MLIFPRQLLGIGKLLIGVSLTDGADAALSRALEIHQISVHLTPDGVDTIACSAEFAPLVKLTLIIHGCDRGKQSATVTALKKKNRAETHALCCVKFINS